MENKNIEKIMNKYRTKIESWNPETQDVYELLDATKEYQRIARDEYELDLLPLDQLTDITQFGVAEKFAELIDRISYFPVWAIDSEGNCIVGAGEWRVEPLSEVYAGLPGWLSITITKHQTEGGETDYILAYGDGTYQTDAGCETSPDGATKFASVEEAREYIICGWPENSTWRGHWISDRVYQIFTE